MGHVSYVELHFKGVTTSSFGVMFILMQFHTKQKKTFYHISCQSHVHSMSNRYMILAGYHCWSTIYGYYPYIYILHIIYVLLLVIYIKAYNLTLMVHKEAVLLELLLNMKKWRNIWHIYILLYKNHSVFIQNSLTLLL